MTITRPTLLLDERTARGNIERMAAKARDWGVRFRPHFKTHQSAVVGRWFRDCGVDAITVSSPEMARGFADCGWRDITVALPVNLRQLDALDALAGGIRLGLLADCHEVLEALDRRLSAPVDLWIEIDPGYGRTGITWDHPEEVLALARAARERRMLRLRGLLTHAGQSYQCSSPEEVRSVWQQTAERLDTLRARLADAGIDVELSAGDTPGCSLAPRANGVDEIRPGNFVFYDLMQFNLGACRAPDIALTAICPVIGVYPERGRIAIYGGTVHLGREPLPATPGRIYFGLALPPEDQPDERFSGAAMLSGLTQEHGMLEAGERLLARVRPGDILRVYPTHACITASQHAGYRTVDGTEIPRLERAGDRGAG